jgi:chemotaxis protein CheX
MEATASSRRENIMPDSSAALKSYGAEEFLCGENLNRADVTVTEIFRMMFGFETEVDETPSSCPTSPETDERTAIVGFSGAMRGSCQVRISSRAAQAIASAMLGGTPIDESDDSVNDALGELCNMLAGGWKNCIPGLSSECALSPPTVISGRNYRVHMSKPSVKLSRTYRFAGHALHLTLCCEDEPLQA